MNICNATEARANFFKLIQDTITNHEPTCVTSKNGNIIVISQEDYDSTQETLYIMSTPKMYESIVEASNQDISECTNYKDVDW